MIIRFAARHFPGEQLKRIPVIINPISGQGIGLKVLPRIEAGLRELGYEPEIFQTQKGGDARDIAAATPDDTPYIVTLGGDGTLNEVLNGVVPREITMAVFPTGTGNVFCKEIGLRRDVDFFLSLFKTGRVKRFDIGRADSRTFISVSGAGFNAEVVRRMDRANRGNMRMIEYIFPVIHACLAYDFPPIRVEVDGELVVEDAFLVEVGNTASYGGPMEFTSLARPDDGLLDICAIRKTARLTVLKHLFGTVTRMHLHYREVKYFKGKHVRLSSTKPVPTHVDGDENGMLPVSYTIMPMAARVLVPAGNW